MYGNGCAGSTPSGREDGEDPLVEDLVEVLAVVEVQVRPAAHHDAVGLDGGDELAEVQVLLLADQVLDPVTDLQQLLSRRPPVGRELRQPGGHLVLQGGHPDLEELVQVGREDGAELQPLQQRRAGIRGQRQHPLVEVEPGELPVEEPRWRAVSRIHQGRHPFQRSAAGERPRTAPPSRRPARCPRPRAGPGPSRARCARARRRARCAPGCAGTGGRRGGAAPGGPAPGP